MKKLGYKADPMKCDACEHYWMDTVIWEMLDGGGRLQFGRINSQFCPRCGDEGNRLGTGKGLVEVPEGCLFVWTERKGRA